MMEKKDWFGLYYQNQNANYTDFLQNGVTPKDVVLNDKDTYKKNDKIIQAFTDKEGKFNETAFNNFYDQAISSFNTFSQGNFKDTELPELEYDIMSAIRRPQDKIQQIDFKINKKRNPFIETQGISSVLGTTEVALSKYEIAQSNLIWDTETNSWMNKTPEDLGFWGTIDETPIIFAKYDEDTEERDPETGRMVKHYKGETKLNEEGLPYYETLGNRAAHNKEFLSPFNVLTKEGSGINKFDFLDNDGKDKSIAGTIAQTVASIAPMFIPYVGEIYTYGLIAKNASQLGITLYKMLDGVYNPDKKDYEYGILNTIEGKLASFSPGTSEYSKEHMVTFENFGNLITDISSQLYQQRLLAKIPSKLGFGNPEQAALKKTRELFGDEIADEILKTGKLSDSDKLKTLIWNVPEISKVANTAKTRNNLYGKWLSSFYMSGISTMDTYNDGLDAGYDRATAALTAALAMGATTWMIGSTEIGQKALQGLGFGEERRVMREISKKLVNEVGDEIKDFAVDPIKNASKFNKLLRKVGNVYKGAGDIISKGGIIGNAVAEGLEEMSEEAIMDTSKEFTDALTAVFGVQKEGSYEFFASNPLERYLMAGIGGAVGGSIFKAANNLSEANSNLPKDTKTQIFHLLTNGKKSELIKGLEDLRKRGVAPKELSAFETEVINGEIQYKPAKGNGDSLNDAVINLAENLINEWDGIINQEALNLDDDSLLSKMSLQDTRIKKLLEFEGIYQITKDYNDIGVKIVELVKENSELKDQISPGKGKEGINVEQNEEKIKQNNAKLLELRKQKDALLNGENTEEYVSKSLFQLSSFKDPILATDIQTYCKYVIGKNYNTLSPSEQEEVKIRYKKYQESFDVKFNEGYKLFQELGKKYGKELLAIADKMPLLDGIRELLSQESEAALLDLDKDALRQFDISRQLNIEKGLTANKGLDYIINHDKLSFQDPNNQAVISDFFKTITLKSGKTDIPIGVDISKITSSKNTFSEFNTEFVDNFLYNLISTNENGELTSFGKLIEDIKSEVKNNANNPNSAIASSDIIQDRLTKYINSTISNPEFKQLALNILNSGYNKDASQYLKNINVGINEIIYKYNYELTPRLKLASAKQLISESKANGVELTKDFYNQLLDYIKPDKDFELDFESLEGEITDMIGIPIKINNLTPEGFNELGISPEDAKYIEKTLNSLGFTDLNELINVSNKLKSAKTWFDVADILKNSKLNHNAKWILSDRLNSANRKNTKSNIKELYAISDFLIDDSKLQSNPVVELLKKIDVDVLGSNDPINIFDLLESENNHLKSAARLSEFVIQGKVKSNQIESAIETVNLLKSIIASSIKSTNIDGSGYGYNTTLNRFRQQNNGEILPEIDQSIANKVLWELNRIKNQLSFYKKLSDKNVGNKLREHKLTAIKTRQAILKNFLDTSFTTKRPEVFEGITEIINSYDTEKLFNSDLSDEEFIQLEELVSKVEDKIYDNIDTLTKSNKFTKSEIINDLFKGQDFSKLVKAEYNNPQALDETLTELKPSELYTYYHTIITVKSSDFNHALKEIINEELKGGSKKFLIPIFSQEFAARINIAMVVDPEFMNNITTVNEERLSSIQSPKSKIVYTNHIDSYKNLVFNNGAPGVGKTNGVGRLTNKIINKLLGDQKIVLVGPQSQQAINLTNAVLQTDFDNKEDIHNINSEINKEGHTVLTKEELLSTIYTDYSVLSSANSDFEKEIRNSKYLDHVSLSEHRFQSFRLKPRYLDKSCFKNDAFKDQRVIYIDEITNFSKFELEALTTWAHINNKIILTFGDLLQFGYRRVSDGLYMGIDVDALKVSSPTLATSLRISNIHKKDNQNVIRTLNEQAYNKELPPNERFKVVNQSMKASPSLKYYEDDKTLHGEKITESTSIQELEKLNNNGGVGYIYDNPESTTYALISEFNNTHEKKIKMFKLGEVQGLEAPFFVVDLHLSFDNSNIENGIKNLYTALTRSETGTIIINNNLTKSYINGSSKVDYTQDSVLNNESAKSFAELRLKSLDNLTKDYKPEGVQEQKSNTTTSDTKPINITIEKVIDKVFDLNESESNKVTEEIYQSDSKVREYPEDSYIAYSYDSRIKEYPIKDKDGNIVSYTIKGDITNSGLYDSDHTSFFNNNYSNLSPIEFKKTDSAIQSVKSVLYSYKSKAKRNEELDKIEFNINTTFRDVTGNTGTLDLKNGKFKLKAIKYFHDGEIHSDGSNRAERLRVVYTIPIINSSTSQQEIELSIYSLPNGNETKFQGKKWFESYKPFYSKILNQVPSDYNQVYTSKYIPLADDFELEKITNLIIYKKDPEGRKHYNFEDRGSQFKGLYFSNPYVVVDYATNKSKRNSELQNISDKILEAQQEYLKIRDKYNTTENLDEKKALGKELNTKLNKLIFETKRYNLKGKAIVFATYAEKIYDENGNIIPESEYGDYYVKQASGQFDSNPDLRDKIRMIVLSPNPLTFREFFNNYDKYVKSYSQSSGNKLGNKFYKSYFGDYTGFDILLSILNYKNWLEINGKIKTKHYEIADRLYRGLSALSKATSQQLTNIKSEGATDFHIMRIMERLHQSFDSQLLEQHKSNAEKINGNDVLRYFREIINNKLREESGESNLSAIRNYDNDGLFFNFDKDISSNNIFDFMEAALTGKVGDKEVPEYNPIFKEGIYPFPVMMYDKDQQGYTGDKNFIRAMNLEGSYYIDRDLQTPQFAFVVSRDLANPEEFGVKKSSKPESPKPEVKKSETNPSPTIKPIETPLEDIKLKNVTESTKYLNNVLNNISNPIIKEEFNKLIPEILSSIEKETGNNLNIKSLTDDLISKVITKLNTTISDMNIPYDSNSTISYIKYKNGEFNIFTRPNLIKNIEENTRKLDENRLYLQNNFGGIFNIPEININDLNTLVENFKLIESNSNNQMNVIKEFVITGKYSPELFNLLTNNNIKSALVDVNIIRSKYNIC